MNKFTPLICLMFLLGCAPRVPVIDLSKVSKDKLHAAYKIKTYTAGSDLTYPEISEYLGDITAYSCQYLMWDPPSSKGNALTQLRLKGLDLGANGIIDVTFDVRGADAWGTDCWESVQASGIAVIFTSPNK
ncbi:hypothetical protein ACFL3G_00695 [Planctomycetota bacterium]